jgi:hypothetical protein
MSYKSYLFKKKVLEKTEEVLMWIFTPRRNYNLFIKKLLFKVPNEYKLIYKAKLLSKDFIFDYIEYKRDIEGAETMKRILNNALIVENLNN